MISCSPSEILKNIELLARQEVASEGKDEEIEIPSSKHRPFNLGFASASQSNRTTRLAVGIEPTRRHGLTPCVDSSTIPHANPLHAYVGRN